MLQGFHLFCTWEWQTALENLWIRTQRPVASVVVMFIYHNPVKSWLFILRISHRPSIGWVHCELRIAATELESQSRVRKTNLKAPCSFFFSSEYNEDAASVGYDARGYSSIKCVYHHNDILWCSVSPFPWHQRNYDAKIIRKFFMLNAISGILETVSIVPL